MPAMPCQFRIDCDTAFLSNYSSEGAEPFPPFYAVVYPPITDIPLDQEWSMPGCLYICKSYISQEDANLCALRQAILCIDGPPPEEIWYSAPASCTTACPDGSSSYTYLVPAGTFVANTYEKALAQAQAYACEQAQINRVCLNDGGDGGGGGGGNTTLGNLPRCACKGVLYSGTIQANGATTDQTWAVVGSLPPGLSFIGAGTGAVIAGTPTVSGTYAFQVVATDSNGNYAIRTFTIQVVEITTNALPDFIIGTPYSHQLTAAGGSGNYTWSVAIGTLPDGLTLSATGLISGTPTALATGGTLTFEVVDVTCETVQKSFFTPHITLSTVGTTRIRTKRGWPDYATGDILYKRLTVTGDFTQTALTAPLINPLTPGNEFCGGAKYVYSGYSEIDNYGNLIVTHLKNLSKACLAGDPVCQTAAINPDGSLFWTTADGVSTLLGYCWDDDPGSCPTCSSDPLQWQAAGNYGTPSQFDFPSNMIRTPANETVTPTVWSYSGFYSVLPKALSGVQGFPLGVVNEAVNVNAAWVGLFSTGAWSLTLSDEYTDANANASAVSYTNNSKVAENRPNYLTYNTGAIVNRSSRTTSVAYVLSLTNLVAGEDYIARVQLWSSNGSHVTISVPFTAAATTHTVIGSVPTPAANTTITVKNPSVVFA